MGMYELIDGLQFIGSLAGFAIGLSKDIKPLYISSAVFFIIYPVLNELFYNTAVELF